MQPTDEESQHPQSATQATKYRKGSMAPRWAAALGALALGILYAALPEYLTIGPSWLPLAIVALLLLPLVLPGLLGRPLPHTATRILAFTLLGVITLALIIGVTFMVLTLPGKKEAGILLREAGLLWTSNILVFALWYWEVDGGGPRKRHESGHQAADLLFPQQQTEQLPTSQMPGKADGTWAPHFMDYLFVAFTGATALSPTDTFPLTHAAKALMMIEAMISLTIIILLAARAVNIL